MRHGQLLRWTGISVLVVHSCVLSCFAFGQTVPPAEFDVASVKPGAPQGDGRRMTMMQGGPGSHDPGRITYTNISLKLILTAAYDVQHFQISGPSWLGTEMYDIAAKVPPGTTKEQAKVMLQNLLAERFHLAHHES
jgi:uncharacterized protein (TIGR03435 family)